MNKQLRCEHICAAAFLAFSGQLRTTGAEDFHKRERGGERKGRERERGGKEKGAAALNWNFCFIPNLHNLFLAKGIVRA